MKHRIPVCSPFASQCRPAWRGAAGVLSWCLLVSTNSHALDVNFVVVLKSQRFQQLGRDLVTLTEEEDEDQLAFEALAFGAAADSIATASVQVPGGPLLPMLQQGPGVPLWGTEEGWSSPLELNDARPDGGYTVHLSTRNEGAQAVAVSLAGATYPPVPRVTNFVALQSINPSADRSVTWPSMGGTNMDFIMFTVRDPDTDATVFETPGPGAAGALDGTAIQVTIPAGRLQPGRIYRAELLTVKTASYANTYCPAIGGCSRSVTLNLTTSTTSSTQSLNSELIRISPGYQRDVARNSLISLRFSRAMNPAVNPVSWLGVDPADMTYIWTDSNRILLCKHDGNLPASTYIEASVNLADFRDVNNQPLHGSGIYGFWTAAADPGAPDDVSACRLIKARGYLQTGAAPVASGLYGCESEVEPSAFNRVKEPLTLAIAANSTNGRLQQDEWDGEFALDATFPDKGSLDQFFPNGNFAFTLNTIKDGPQAVTLSLGATDDYPAAPSISNLAALQSINHAAPAVVSWTAPAGWNQSPSVGNTFIEIEIENDQGNEVFYAGPDSGTISANGCTIPAGTLWPGRSYHVWLSFTKIKDVDSTYGMNGAGFRSVTEFSAATAGTPVMPVATIAGNPEDGCRLTMRGGEPSRNYVLEASPDLARWLPQAGIWLDELFPSPVYQDFDSVYLPARYYRLRDGQQGQWVRRNVTIQGTVWTDAAHSTPAAGAVIGTSLDTRTTIAGSDGGFFLETDTAGNGSATPYTIHVTVGPQTRDFGPHGWGDQPREQYLEFSTGGFGVEP